ncbi:hypothetical protein SEUCBS140593_007772 [Sporothrix eucalyptigena]|uniref:Uncharacterized protein n=1 Tax=Sporothrix eucalyptigena TaxID=1812306 RepID=A0ABP0CFZ5_9PEZI
MSSTSDTLVAAAPAPSLNIPNGATVSVKIIDTTSTIKLPLENIMGPHLLESDWKGRNLVELEFNSGLKIGQFRAIDYFHDGSFYLLDAPGHAVGHTCALARVTKGGDGGSDTFVLMAGDTCHHGGQWKPNQYLPLPSEVAIKSATRGRPVCPGILLQGVHRNNSATTGFYEMAPSFPNNYTDAKNSIQSMQEFDAAQNVLVIIAHDCAPLEPESGFTFFPHGSLNNWKAEKLDERIRWNFLDDFAPAAEKNVKQETTLKGGLVYK